MPDLLQNIFTSLQGASSAGPLKANFLMVQENYACQNEKQRSMNSKPLAAMVYYEGRNAMSAGS